MSKTDLAEIFDPYNRDSLYRKAPPGMKKAMDNIPKYLLGWSEDKIERTYKHKITTRDRIFKTALWREYQYALDNNKSIVILQVIRGVCPEKYYYNNILKTPWLLKWMLHPPISYEASMEEMLDASTTRLREILALPLHTENGKVDHRTLSLQIKIHELVVNRVKGVNPHTLNINQKSLNVNASADAAILEGQRIDQLSLKELDTELMKLEKNPVRPQDIIGKKVLEEDEKAAIDGEYHIDVTPVKTLEEIDDKEA